MDENHKENKVSLKWRNALEEEQRGEEEGWGGGEIQVVNIFATLWNIKKFRVFPRSVFMRLVWFAIVRPIIALNNDNRPVYRRGTDLVLFEIGTEALSVI